MFWRAAAVCLGSLGLQRVAALQVWIWAVRAGSVRRCSGGGGGGPCSLTLAAGVRRSRGGGAVEQRVVVVVVGGGDLLGACDFLGSGRWTALMQCL